MKKTRRKKETTIVTVTNRRQVKLCGPPRWARAGAGFTSSACFGVWEACIDVVYVLLTSV